jgi:type VI protein secretion system component Hcp
MFVTRATRFGFALAISVAMASMLAGAQLLAQGDALRACVNTAGSLRVVSSSETCKSNEVAVAWNVTGPPGPAGPAGPAGPEGPAGRDGRDGRDATGPATPPMTLTGTLFIDDNDFGPATPILAFSLGATNSGTVFGGGGGAGKVDFSNFNLTKLLDGYSLPLLQKTATGEHLKQVRIELFDHGAATPFATYRLADVTVVASNFGGAPTGVSENVSLQFSRIDSTIVLDGNTFTSCYDVKANKNC